VAAVTWRAALFCWGFALVLGAVYALTEPAKSLEPSPMPALGVTSTDQPGPPAYELTRDRVEAVEARRGDQVVRWVPSGPGWRVEKPEGVNIPQGILDAFVEQIVDGATSERLEGTAVADTGLDEPALEIRVDEAGGGHLTLSIGSRTPTATAVYGRVEETGTLFVAGLSFLTYADLLFAPLR